MFGVLGYVCLVIVDAFDNAGPKTLSVFSFVEQEGSSDQIVRINYRIGVWCYVGFVCEHWRATLHGVIGSRILSGFDNRNERIGSRIALPAGEIRVAISVGSGVGAALGTG